MDNFVAEGKTINYTLAASAAVGKLIDLGDRAGVVTVTGQAGDVVPVLVEGIVSYAKAAVNVDNGAKLYYHAGNDNVTTSSSSAKAVGWAANAKLSSVLTGQYIKLGAF